MNLVRVLLILILGFILWSFFKRWLHSQRDDELEESSTEKPQPTVKEGGKMLRCEYCEVHFPAADAVYFKNKPFCCEEHKQRFDR